MAGKAFGVLRTAGFAAIVASALAAPAAANNLAGDYLAARQASFLGDFKAAAEYYGRSVAFDPGNPELLERATLAHLSLGDIPHAVSLADQLSKQGFQSQVGHMAQIAELAQREDYDALLKRIRDKTAIGPLVDGLVAAWSELGRGDMSAALVAFDTVAEEKGLAPFAYYHKAMALASVGDFEGAEAIFAERRAGSMQLTRRAVMARAEILSQLDRQAEAVAMIDEGFPPPMDPGLVEMRQALVEGASLPFTYVNSAKDGVAEVFYTLAGALSAEANDDFTLLYSRIAEYLRPDHVGAILLSANLLESLGQYDLAVAAYKNVPRDDSSYYAAELGRAEALRSSGKVDAAVEVLEQLAETDGEQATVQSALGDLMRQLDRYEEAVTAYDSALATFSEPSPTQWFLYYARGISKERLKDWEAAEADFRAALKLNPDQPQVLNYLGYSLVEHHVKLDEALSMIERAVAAQPQSGYIVDSLGWALYRLGRYQAAVVHMERAAELMPVDPVVNDHLGDVYWAVGRDLEAEFQWKRALSFVNWEEASDEVDPERIRRKLKLGLDQVLAEEGAPPLTVANGAD
ncbi:tetratricopeptide repeat protein [Salipiger sp. P9]|uniref:tetratricopeptide repeat protein n=1 Tax=Salipiger pentaromativorans TaxID=2943193 RepID=UPI0021579F5A|nr:tetratricopeptide repeat protein [Salipiger pentaromativorans]MCR8548353.1 tetratricopeptide repeat protein [Salipiger pentaromativorans]